LLQLDNFCDGLVLDRDQFRLLGFALGDFVALLDKVVRT